MIRQNLDGVSASLISLPHLQSQAVAWCGFEVSVELTPSPHCGLLCCASRYDNDVAIFIVLLHPLEKTPKVQGETQLSVTSAIRIKKLGIGSEWMRHPLFACCIY